MSSMRGLSLHYELLLILLECYLRSALHLMRNTQLVSYMNVTHDARATKGVRE